MIFDKRIEGLSELDAAYEARELYNYKFNKMMSSEGNDGARPPVLPKVKVEEVETRYPKAKAFRIAREHFYSKYLPKHNAGEKAMKRILDGENYEKVIREMKAEIAKDSRNID
jgi:hypothetical protein